MGDGVLRAELIFEFITNASVVLVSPAGEVHWDHDLGIWFSSHLKIEETMRALSDKPFSISTR